MNLLDEPWLPVRDAGNHRHWIAPAALGDPAWIAFDADRADFNGALTQFAIGLLQTAAPVKNAAQWRGWFRQPPDATTLDDWFAPLRPAFEFDGNGARFMQDRTLASNEGACNDIGALLIEAPGEQTLKNNADHFIKRGQITALCPTCAATALLTLQINAPSGGAGHRTGLRGGGPLTTLVACQPARTLWHDLWLNVLEQEVFLAQAGDARLARTHFTFPWMADIATLQKEKGELAPIQTHPAHVHWAMPRRIRLDFSDTVAGDCGVCGRYSDTLLQRYVTRNYGLNYKGAWNHPLSPYYQNGEDWLPMHPQPGGIGYRHWLGWVLGQTEGKKSVRPARVVSHLCERRRRDVEGQLRLWAFGYDMDNMKARCWYEAQLPLYGLAECETDAQREVEEAVRPWLAGAELTVFFLRSAVKQAWFDDEARGDFSAIDASFWSGTELPFYRLLRQAIDHARLDREIDAGAFATGWHRQLRQIAIDLFDRQFVGAGAVERQNPRRVAEAHRQLQRNLDGKKLRTALGLPIQIKANPTETEHALT
ncbi:MAG TPA: type I-E CRISPR-associated protein Cse1/CasA [Thauera aminoaromatica]|jgi:CRISPR system Cascade subunit CasA|nr:type I-E CRISPR-associated protein Cse1/CasA [Thauera aminoaromatica]